MEKAKAQRRKSDELLEGLIKLAENGECPYCLGKAALGMARGVRRAWHYVQCPHHAVGRVLENYARWVYTHTEIRIGAEREYRELFLSSRGPHDDGAQTLVICTTFWASNLYEALGVTLRALDTEGRQIEVRIEKYHTVVHPDLDPGMLKCVKKILTWALTYLEALSARALSIPLAPRKRLGWVRAPWPYPQKLAEIRRVRGLSDALLGAIQEVLCKRYEDCEYQYAMEEDPVWRQAKEDAPAWGASLHEYGLSVPRLWALLSEVTRKSSSRFPSNRWLGLLIGL